MMKKEYHLYMLLVVMDQFKLFKNF